MGRPDQFHVAVALEGAGWHPAAWRHRQARPRELFQARYWSDLAAVAERGLLDFVTIEDSMTMQSSTALSAGNRIGDDRTDYDRTDRVRGRLDAVLVAARVAPLTRRLGLIPAATTTHTEPFHLSKAIATLDYVSTGRAGIQLRIGGSAAEAALFGRRSEPPVDLTGSDDPAVQQAIADHFAEAADYAEVLRRLWDSWDDDAVIKDASTGRYIDRDRLRYIDFEGRWFAVRGPSVTPRPPQGQPIIAALARGPLAYELAVRQADVVFVTPQNRADAETVLTDLRALIARFDRRSPLRVFVDLAVFIDSHSELAADRKEELDQLDGQPFASDAGVFVGSADALADQLAELAELGYDGVRLRPACLPADLVAIADELTARLQRRNLFRGDYESDSLRGHLGLSRPVNRYRLSQPIR